MLYSAPASKIIFRHRFGSFSIFEQMDVTSFPLKEPPSPNPLPQRERVPNLFDLRKRQGAVRSPESKRVGENGLVLDIVHTFPRNLVSATTPFALRRPSSSPSWRIVADLFAPAETLGSLRPLNVAGLPLLNTSMNSNFCSYLLCDRGGPSR